MRAPRTRYEDPWIQPTDRRTPGHDRGPAILILGSCGGDVFVADEILICADTLGNEEAVRAWLGQHGIHVTASDEEKPSTAGRDQR
jgi:hypothetical protein